jgi:hypothetical protein
LVLLCQASFCSSEKSEKSFAFHLAFSSLCKLYECSEQTNSFENEMFALTGIINLYKTSYNSNLEIKLVNSIDAGLAYARRWLIYKRECNPINAHNDFVMAKQLLEAKYGEITKEKLKGLIRSIDHQKRK